MDLIYTKSNFTFLTDSVTIRKVQSILKLSPNPELEAKNIIMKIMNFCRKEMNTQTKNTPLFNGNTGFHTMYGTTGSFIGVDFTLLQKNL